MIFFVDAVRLLIEHVAPQSKNVPHHCPMECGNEVSRNQL